MVARGARLLFLFRGEKNIVAPCVPVDTFPSTTHVQKRRGLLIRAFNSLSHTRDAATFAARTSNETRVATERFPLFCARSVSNSHESAEPAAIKTNYKVFPSHRAIGDNYAINYDNSASANNGGTTRGTRSFSFDIHASTTEREDKEKERGRTAAPLRG